MTSHPEIDNMTAQELTALIEAAQSIRKKKLKEAVATLREQFEERATQLGLTPDDVLSTPHTASKDKVVTLVERDLRNRFRIVGQAVHKAVDRRLTAETVFASQVVNKSTNNNSTDYGSVDCIKNLLGAVYNETYNFSASDSHLTEKRIGIILSSVDTALKEETGKGLCADDIGLQILSGDFQRHSPLAYDFSRRSFPLVAGMLRKNGEWFKPVHFDTPILTDKNSANQNISPNTVMEAILFDTAEQTIRDRKLRIGLLHAFMRPRNWPQQQKDDMLEVRAKLGSIEKSLTQSKPDRPNIAPRFNLYAVSRTREVAAYCLREFLKETYPAPGS